MSKELSYEELREKLLQSGTPKKVKVSSSFQKERAQTEAIKRAKKAAEIKRAGGGAALAKRLYGRQ